MPNKQKIYKVLWGKWVIYPEILKPLCSFLSSMLIKKPLKSYKALSYSLCITIYIHIYIQKCIYPLPMGGLYSYVTHAESPPSCVLNNCLLVWPLLQWLRNYSPSKVSLWGVSGWIIRKKIMCCIKSWKMLLGSVNVIFQSWIIT